VVVLSTPGSRGSTWPPAARAELAPVRDEAAKDRLPGTTVLISA
jgi:hypothetical protein